MKTALVLDYDGVIRHLNPELVNNKLVEDGIEITLSELFQIIFGNQHGTNLIEGKITREVWWDLLSQEYDMLSKFKQEYLWNDLFDLSVLDKQLLDYVNSLNDKLITVILSNADPKSTETIIKETENYHFDYILSSGYFGVAKPKTEIYQKLSSTINVAPNNIYFFDDSQKNVDGAIQFGINAYFYKNMEQIKSIISSLD